ncbi:CAP1 protein, partial [Acromyrmex insinuator]
MFKCCVCNSASKANAEREDDTPVGSPKLTAASVEVDDEIKFATRVDKLNGDVQKSEKTSPENISLENKDVSLEDKVVSSENKDALLEDKDALPEDKDASPEKNKDASLEDKDSSLENKDASLEDKNISPEDKDVSLEDKDVTLENKNVMLEDKDATLENKDASLEDKDILLEAKNVSLNSTPICVNSLNSTPIRVYSNGNTDIEESSSSSSTKETVEEADEESVYKIVDDKDNSNLDGIAEDWTQPIENVDSIGTVAPVKTNLYDASGYIERTIDDGPEDEGDDSVFEGYPSENETIKKTSPVSSIPRWLSEEDDGEYVSGGCSGMQEPPATPVARDELALRRHRFFSDLLQAAQNSTEHRVRFDPLGPMVHTGRESTDKEEHLEELVNRLENVTRRLENVHFAVQTQDIAVQTSTPSPRRSTSSGSSLSLSSKQETVPNPPTKMSIAGYEDFLAGPVKEYLQLSQKIGGDVDLHSKIVERAFQVQLQFIHMAASRPAPTNQSEQLSLFAPMSAQIQHVQEFREKNRGSLFFNHLSAISESIPALGWVAVSPTPAPYVKEMNDAGQFYTNRVLKDWKEKNKIHIDWCKAWVQTLTDLQQYVRQHHTTGLVWGKTGASAGVCIPPPPPPSMPIGDIAPTLNDDRSALFAQINQGEDITKSLKKVTSDMQTHKNPALRSGPAPFKAPVNAIPMKTVLSANAPIDKPPVFTKDGKKWLVEYHKGENLVIDNVEMNNVVYMFRCQDSTLTVKGKVNSVVMDSCRKSSVVFDSLVSSIEFVNCQSVQMQVCMATQ